MTFTPQTPTTPGYFLWKEKEPDEPIVLILKLTQAKRHKEPKLLCKTGYSPKFYGGLWHRLVSSEEVEKAYKEAALGFTAHIEHHWLHSRAKQVAEGNYEN